MSKRKLVSFDWAMKKLLRSKANFEILEGFLSELLKDDIKILEILESESNKEHALDKYNRVDLKVKNQKGEIIIIEVQYEREYDFLQRIIYGTAKVITEHISEQKPYSKITKVISVNILYFDLGHGTDYIYHGTTIFKGLHNQDLLEFSDTQNKLYQRHKIHEIFPEYYLIKVNSFDDIARDTLDEWVYFLKNEEIKENFNAKGLRKARQELEILKMPEADRQAYDTYQEDLRYNASMYESSYIVGEIKGREKGIEIGREKGIEQGIEQGIAIGREQRLDLAIDDVEKKKAIEIARKMLNIHDIKTISEITGLTEEEIEELKPKS
jgi:predicted transposase/invertase (TIGR01784 family)